jgi:hypothetical protein
VQYRIVCVAKAHHAEHEARAPRQYEEPGNCRERSRKPAQFRAGANRDPDDIRAGQGLAEANDVEEFRFAEPASLLDGEAPGPNEAAAEAE